MIMGNKQEELPTLGDDLENSGYKGNIYIRPDIISSFAYEIKSLYPTQTGPDFPINIRVQKFNLENGSLIPSDHPWGDEISLTTRLNDGRADDELVKKIRDHSS
jgi:hypothetical protein